MSLYSIDNIAVNLMNEIWGMIISVAGWIIIYILKNSRADSIKIYFSDLKFMLMCNIISMGSDFIGTIFNGTSFPQSGLIVQLANTILYSSNYLLLFRMSLYVIHCLGKKLHQNVYGIIVTIGLVFNLTMLAIDQFTGMMFYVDASNVYHRGPYFIVTQGIGVAFEVVNLILAIAYRKKLDTYMLVCIGCFTILPIAGVIAGLLVDDIVFLFMATSASLFIYLLCLCLDNAKKVALQQQQLAEQSMNAMISQIQPHFLYNSISAIIGIEGNPPETRKALTDFGKYLRGNLDVLKSGKPIPFSRELDHVRAYVSLEKVRFDEKLEVIYNIEETNFYLPALTVQMMTENAIKHGIRQKGTKGTVTITTRAEVRGVEDWAVIVIEDDGVGFDPTQKPKEDGRSHVGLQNVKARLEQMVGGTIEIESEIGKGTRVTISVPR